MKPVFTFNGIREAEKKIIEQDGVPSLILMENAGKNAFDILCIKYPDIQDYSIYIFCGKGNNAGDGFVIARQMAINGIETTIVTINNTNDLSGDALINFRLLNKLNTDKISFISFDEFSAMKDSPLKKGKVLVIDAILGSGVKGELNETFSKAVSFLNAAKNQNKKLQIASIDVPSGLMSGKQINPLVNADVTITMAAVKSEMLYGEGKENCGEIFVSPIGITDTSLENSGGFVGRIIGYEDIQPVFPKRKKSSYKYSNGKALLIGGSKGLSGALIMSAMAAIRAGCGGISVAYPESLSPHFGRKLYDVTKLELEETVNGSISSSFRQIEQKLNKTDAILLGPGISTDSKTKSFVFDVIKNCKKPLVIDADALTLISDDVSILNNRNNNNEIILTPHIGEFSRLSGLSTEGITANRFESVKEFAKKYNVNVVMKSETTFCCLVNGEIYFNLTGNEALATVGSGDVLSGIIAALLSQTKNVKTAVMCGCYLHGVLAEMYFEKAGNKQSAAQRDFIRLIPKAVTEILRK
jgi:ADP-dependent NAD(P)H-hydrate dehydratase / NAD(P)H-hydrate epimerase